MIHEETIQKLLDLKLVAMAAAARELTTSAPDQQLTPQEILGMMVDRDTRIATTGGSRAG